MIVQALTSTSLTVNGPDILLSPLGRIVSRVLRKIGQEASERRRVSLTYRAILNYNSSLFSEALKKKSNYKLRLVHFQ